MQLLCVLVLALAVGLAAASTFRQEYPESASCCEYKKKCVNPGDTFAPEADGASSCVSVKCTKGQNNKLQLLGFGCSPTKSSGKNCKTVERKGKYPHCCPQVKCE